MATPVHSRAERFDRIATVVAVAAWFLALYAVGLRREPFGDEPRFIDIVRTFGTSFELDTLRTYPAMTTPLAFLAYAAWGRVVGFDVWQLRLLSPLLAIATCVLFDRVLRGYGVARSARVAALAVIALNPYFAGLGAFVFTDMLSLLAVVVVIEGVRTRSAWVVGLGVAAAVLTRQYDVFVALAVAASAVLARPGLSAVEGRRSMVLASLLGLVPTLLLMWFWGGPAPDSVYRAELLEEPFNFNPHWLSLYLAASGIYAAPLVLWQLVRRPPSARVIAAAAAVASLTLFFPVQPAAVQIAQCCPDTGYVHRALLSLQLPGLAAAVFFVSAAACLATVPSVFRDVREMFPWLAVAAFLLVMPFSYMPWEKYILPHLLFVVLLLSRALSSTSESAPETRRNVTARAAETMPSRTAPHPGS